MINLIRKIPYPNGSVRTPNAFLEVPVLQHLIVSMVNHLYNRK